MYSHLDERISGLSISSSGCRLWDGGLSHNGYARTTVGGCECRIGRYVLEKKLGRRLLPRMQALHTCDVRECVAEDHLFEGTNQDNVDDKVRKGRQSRGSRLPNTSLSDDKILCIRKMYSMGYKNHQLAALFRTSTTTIHRIVTRTSWTHI